MKSFEIGRLLIDPQEQWSQFFGRCNWYTFNPILIELEDERCMGGVEVTVIIMGLGLRVRWTYNSKPGEELAARADELLAQFEKIED